MFIAILRFVVITVIGVFLIEAVMRLLKTMKNIVTRKMKRNRKTSEALQTAL